MDLRTAAELSRAATHAPVPALHLIPPSSPTQKPKTASATGAHTHTATSLLADADSCRGLSPALLRGQHQAPDFGKNALRVGQTETTPHKPQAAVAFGTDLPVETVSADAQNISVQQPTAPQTDPPTDRQTHKAAASVSPSADISPQTVLSPSGAAEEVKPAVEPPFGSEVSSQGDAHAQAPAGPDADPAPAPGKAQTIVDDVALLAGLAISPPQPTRQASAQANREDVQMASATGLGGQPTAASLAVATDDSPIESSAKAAAVLEADTADQAVSTGTDGSVAQPLPAAEAATEAAAQETAVPADALRSAAMTAGKLQTQPTNGPPSSVPQKVGTPTEPAAAASLLDPFGLPPPPPTSSSRKEAAPCNPAGHSDAHAAVSNSVAQAAAQSPNQWWTMCQVEGLAAGLVREAATAQAPVPSPYQASLKELASVPLPHQASMQGAAPMNTAVSKQASGPSSHQEPYSAANSLSVATTAVTPPDQASDSAADPTGHPVTNYLHAQVFTPPWAGAEPTIAHPSISAARAAGSHMHVPAADQQLAAGQPAGQQPVAATNAGASASAVAPAVMSQPKRATRSRQSTAAKEAAAPAASLITTTMSRNGMGAELVGQRIEIWWSGEKRYLPGVVKSFIPSKVLPYPQSNQQEHVLEQLHFADSCMT